jgi:hypothetical protein
MTAKSKSKPKMNIESVWQQALNELRNQTTKGTFAQNFLGSTVRQYDSENGILYINARNRYAPDWVNNRMKDTVDYYVSFFIGEDVSVCFLTEDEALPSVNGSGPGDKPQEEGVTVPATAVSPSPAPPQNWEESDAESRRLIGPDGYGGNLSKEEREALLARIREREEGAELEDGEEPSKLIDVSKSNKRGPKYQTPRPAKDTDGSIDGDGVEIDVLQRDPMKAHLETPHYAIRFWQPLLGMNAFALWKLLRSYYFFVRNYGAKKPTIKLLCLTLGWSDPRTLYGRNGQGGAVQVLEKHGICKHITTGKGRHVRHHFREILDDLPILTPAQVACLAPQKQAEHHAFLSYYEFDYDAWKAIEKESLVDDHRAKQVF